jgi:hypothetical protein
MALPVLRDGFEVVQGCGGLEGSDIRGGQIEGGKFDHLVSGRVVDPADHYTDMAHGKLLRHSVAHILPHLRTIRIEGLLLPRPEADPTLMRAYGKSPRAPSHRGHRPEKDRKGERK